MTEKNLDMECMDYLCIPEWVLFVSQGYHKDIPTPSLYGVIVLAYIICHIVDLQKFWLHHRIEIGKFNVVALVTGENPLISIIVKAKQP